MTENLGMVVKATADEHGAWLRVWVDDVHGHHLCTSEVRLSPVLIASIVADIERAQEQSAQYQLQFDD